MIVWGHKEGDQLIQHTAQALQENVRSNDIVARIGGDEFVILSIENNKAELSVCSIA